MQSDCDWQVSEASLEGQFDFGVEVLYATKKQDLSWRWVRNSYVRSHYQNILVLRLDGFWTHRDPGSGRECLLIVGKLPKQLRKLGLNVLLCGYEYCS
jgi:hypothetical protein